LSKLHPLPTRLSSDLGIFYKVDYTVIPKRALDNGDQVDDYIRAVQDHPKVRGFNTFTVEEGDKLVILSLGEDMEGNSIEVLDVKDRKSTRLNSSHVSI